MIVKLCIIVISDNAIYCLNLEINKLLKKDFALFVSFCSCIYYLLLCISSVLWVFLFFFLFLSWAWLYHVYRYGHFGIGEFIQNILFGIIMSSLWTVTTWWPISEFVHCLSSFLSMWLFPSILYCWKYIIDRTFSLYNILLTISDFKEDSALYWCSMWHSTSESENVAKFFF